MVASRPSWVRPLGKGKVYYFAAQLSLADRKAIYDRVMEVERIARPIRVLTADGKYPEGVESRTVPIDGGYVTYLHNETGQSQTVQLNPPRPLGHDVQCQHRPAADRRHHDTGPVRNEDPDDQVET